MGVSGIFFYVFNEGFIASQGFSGFMGAVWFMCVVAALWFFCQLWCFLDGFPSDVDDVYGDCVLDLFLHHVSFYVFVLHFCDGPLLVVGLVGEFVYEFEVVGLVEVAQAPEHLEEEFHVAKDVEIGEVSQLGLEGDEEALGDLVLAVHVLVADVEVDEAREEDQQLVEDDLPAAPVAVCDHHPQGPHHVDDPEREGDGVAEVIPGPLVQEIPHREEPDPGSYQHRHHRVQDQVQFNHFLPCGHEEVRYDSSQESSHRGDHDEDALPFRIFADIKEDGGVDHWYPDWKHEIEKVENFILG